MPAPPEAAPAPAIAVEVKGLTKLYRGSNRQPDKLALDGVDLAIPRGAIFGLLGPNGAGKSTLINILAGLVLKTGGTANIWGIDIDAEPRQARAAIGVVAQELNIDAFFTPRELLDMQAGLYGVPRSERRTTEILAALKLTAQADAFSRTLSGGMKRRLMIGKAMVHNPPVLVLDEPTAGVDVELRRQLWELVRALNASGTTILLTTHYLEEAEALCERIAIIDKGRVVANDATGALVGRIDDKTLTIHLVGVAPALPTALAAFGLTRAAPDRLVLRYRPSTTTLAPILAEIQAQGLVIRDVQSEETDLEAIFLQLTGGASGAPP
ncbi:MAG TPA: ABC transporter ATP-binding protein [Stellaceae bacterium]|nr:ABC transporter ATP-binding protein [Stellaceae bacterium]